MKLSEIRAEARKKLTGNWTKCALYTLLLTIISMLYSSIEGFLNQGILKTLFDILWYIIYVPISYGFVATFMNIFNGNTVDIFYFLTEGFKNFKKVWKVTLQTLLKLIGWFSLLILSMVLLGISILSTAASSVISLGAISSFTNFGVLGTISLILLLVSLVGLTIKELSYVLNFFILFEEPELSSKEIVNKSEQLMNNNRSRYFCLSLSFIGWAILALFTFGIGYFFLIPYIQISMIVFYKKLTKKIDTDVQTDNNKNSDTNNDNNNGVIQNF